MANKDRAAPGQGTASKSTLDIDSDTFKAGGHAQDQPLVCLGNITTKGGALRVYIPSEVVKEIKKIIPVLPSKAFVLYNEESVSFFVTIPKLPALTEFIEHQNNAIQNVNTKTAVL